MESEERKHAQPVVVLVLWSRAKGVFLAELLNLRCVLVYSGVPRNLVPVVGPDRVRRGRAASCLSSCDSPTIVHCH